MVLICYERIICNFPTKKWNSFPLNKKRGKMIRWVIRVVMAFISKRLTENIMVVYNKHLPV